MSICNNCSIIIPDNGLDWCFPESKYGGISYVIIAPCDIVINNIYDLQEWCYLIKNNLLTITPEVKGSKPKAQANFKKQYSCRADSVIGYEYKVIIEDYNAEIEEGKDFDFWIDISKYQGVYQIGYITCEGYIYGFNPEQKNGTKGKLINNATIEVSHIIEEDINSTSFFNIEISWKSKFEITPIYIEGITDIIEDLCSNIDLYSLIYSYNALDGLPRINENIYDEWINIWNNSNINLCTLTYDDYAECEAIIYSLLQDVSKISVFMNMYPYNNYNIWTQDVNSGLVLGIYYYLNFFSSFLPNNIFIDLYNLIIYINGNTIPLIIYAESILTTTGVSGEYNIDNDILVNRITWRIEPLLKMINPVELTIYPCSRENICYCSSGGFYVKESSPFTRTTRNFLGANTFSNIRQLNKDTVYYNTVEEYYKNNNWRYPNCNCMNTSFICLDSSIYNNFINELYTAIGEYVNIDNFFNDTNNNTLYGNAPINKIKNEYNHYLSSNWILCYIEWYKNNIGTKFNNVTILDGNALELDAIDNMPIYINIYIVEETIPEIEANLVINIISINNNIDFLCHNTSIGIKITNESSLVENITLCQNLYYDSINKEFYC